MQYKEMFWDDDALRAQDSDRSGREAVSRLQAMNETLKPIFADQLMLYPEAIFAARKANNHLPGAYTFARTYQKGVVDFCNDLAQADRRWIISENISEPIGDIFKSNGKPIAESLPKIELPAGRTWIEMDEPCMARLGKALESNMDEGLHFQLQQGFLLDVDHTGRRMDMSFALRLANRIEFSIVDMSIDFDDPEHMKKCVTKPETFFQLWIHHDNEWTGDSYLKHTGHRLGRGSGIPPTLKEKQHEASLRLYSDPDTRDRMHPDMPYQPGEMMNAVQEINSNFRFLLAILSLMAEKQLVSTEDPTEIPKAKHQKTAERLRVVAQRAPTTSTFKMKLH
ncbi:MAG: hypothetical protein ABJN42_26960 [Roseibium sp.]|uniref:hypothetical protein n=1 Tax=Roseibium sp. TaxID=1936156 RepID=UPI0032974FF4